MEVDGGGDGSGCWRLWRWVVEVLEVLKVDGGGGGGFLWCWWRLVEMGGGGGGGGGWWWRFRGEL